MQLKFTACRLFFVSLIVFVFSVLMFSELPFFNLDKESFDECLNNDRFKEVFNERLTDCGLRDYLLKLCKNQTYVSLDSEYYTSAKFNSKFKNIKNDVELSIFHLNIHSLNSKQRGLCTLIDLLELEFDVIILSEIWANNITFYCNIFEGYSFYYDLPKNTSIGGLGIYVKTDLVHKQRSDLHLSSSNTLKCENMWVEVTKNKHKYLIGGVYRHPNQNILEFTSALENNLDKISKGNVPCIIAGDINIDFLKITTNKQTENYLNALLTHNFTPTLLLPTRLTRTSTTAIDHFYYYEGRNCKRDFKLTTGNLISDLSDHLPNFMLLSNMKRVTNYNDRPFIRLHTERNKKKFNECLISVDWKSILYDKDNVNDCYDTFISTVKLHYENCFPLTRMSRRAYKDKKWVTKGLKTSIHHKEKLYKKWLLTRNPTDEARYNMYCKIYKKVARKAEILFYNDQFDTKANSVKQIWKNLNNACSVKNSAKKQNVLTKLNVAGKDINDPSEISNAFNDYFCAVGSTLVGKLPSISCSYTDYMNVSISNSMFVDFVRINELLLLIDELRCDKSSGADNIGPHLIKDNKFILCEPLTYIFNLSLIKGIVPDQLKIAKVIPIFKKGETDIASNYRPISLLSIFNKLLEKLVYKRLYIFLLNQKVLYKHQFGFRKNHSTTMALIEVIDNCYKNLDENKKVVGIYFDLQKAFDTVDHSILLHKLHNYGIRGFMYAWIKNYLLNRQQFTLINNVASNLGKITCGVPQGSVLGPLLFLIYINDIANAVGGDKLRIFADDTNLFIAGNSFNDLEVKANVCLNQMQLWFVSNKLSLNYDKTCYTVFSGKAKCIQNVNLNLCINGQYINRVACCKYLGVYIDESLNWNNHVETVYKKLLKFTGIFYKLRDVLPSHCLHKLYYAFIYPHILYGIEVYANTTKNSLDKLCKLNNKLLRILLNKKLLTPTAELYFAMNTLPIPVLHEMQLLVFMFKCFYCINELPEIFTNYFTFNTSIHQYSTRLHNSLHVPVCHSKFGSRHTSYRGGKLWNNLPNNLKVNSSLDIFKKNLKIYLIKNLSNK